MSTNVSELISGLQKHERVSFHFLLFRPAHYELSKTLVSTALGELDHPFLQSTVITFLREIVYNALKANIKRVFLKEQGVDSSNPEEYENAMTRFRKEVVDGEEKFLAGLKELKLGVEVAMQLDKDGLQIDITNNCGMYPGEAERVRHRVDIAAQINDITEAFDSIADSTEGAGLGLTMCLMLLRSSGIGIGNFKLQTAENITRISLYVPRFLNRPARLEQIEKLFLEVIDGLPTFPESIQKVVNLCDDPDSDMHQVSSVIEKDPALSTDIIKIANSGGFLTVNKSLTIADAVTKVGLQVVRNVAIASGSRKVLNEHFKTYRGYWIHAFQVGFYSKQLADMLGMTKESDSIYLGGLLHDLGKMVIHTVTRETAQKLNQLRVDQIKRTSSTLEEISLGISHSTLGGRMAQKWNFNLELIEMIQYHHYPAGAAPQNRKAVLVVYLANALVNIEEQKGIYLSMFPEVFNQLGIKNEQELESIHTKLKLRYENSSNPF